MLRRPNVGVAECYQQARHCAEQAKGILDLKLRHHFRLLEQGWLKTARGMEAADRFAALIRRGKQKAT